MLTVLFSYLSPIGKHRRAHIKPSKGKRAEKKRKWKQRESDTQATPMAADMPPKPEIASQIDVGFNSITTGLQRKNPLAAALETVKKTENSQKYSMVFVCRGNQTAAFNSHFPQMVAASTISVKTDQATRLVGFSKPCSDRLSTSLGIARVSSVAIHVDAAGSDALWNCVRMSVPASRCDWLEEAQSLEYRQSQVVSMETSVGVKKIKQAAVA